MSTTITPLEEVAINLLVPRYQRIVRGADKELAKSRTICKMLSEICDVAKTLPINTAHPRCASFLDLCDAASAALKEVAPHNCALEGCADD